MYKIYKIETIKMLPVRFFFSLVFPVVFEDKFIFAGKRKGFASVHGIDDSSTCLAVDSNMPTFKKYESY